MWDMITMKIGSMMMKLRVMLTFTKFALSDAITFGEEFKHRCVFDA